MPQLNGYLARPAGDRSFPAVVVIHEAFGLNDDIRSIARRFAEEGYVALRSICLAVATRSCACFA